MKLVLDERLKQRLVGLAVIVSIAAIFAPAIVKKSNQRFDGKNVLSVKLPSKPALPKVALPEKETLFKSVKVAHVDIPSVSAQPLSTLAKAEPLSKTDHLQQSLASADRVHVLASNIAAIKQPMPSAAPAAVEIKQVAIKQQPKLSPPTVKVSSQLEAKSIKTKPILTGNYSVQLATFSQQKNAISLVNKLKGKGYKAYFSKINDKNGTVYKVLVGNENKKQQALVLQQKLANSMQIKGFIVPSTGIS